MLTYISFFDILINWNKINILGDILMTNIYLIRHAESLGNIEKRLTGRVDYNLTDKGYEQVKVLTEKLKDVHFDVAYSSPFVRTIETIKPIADLNNLDITKENKLSEMYFGIYDGFKWEQVDEIDSSISNNRKQTNEISGIPRQENTKQVENRMYDAILDIINENKGKNILISSHGVAIEAFLRKITGEPFCIKKQEYSQKNTSINIIQYDEQNNKLEIKLLNN